MENENMINEIGSLLIQDFVEDLSIDLHGMLESDSCPALSGAVKMIEGFGLSKDGLKELRLNSEYSRHELHVAMFKELSKYYTK